MAVTIPDKICTATHLSEIELKQEISVMLYQKEKLTLAQASKLAGLDRIQFQHLLASRKIPINISIEDIDHDFNVLKKLHKK